LREYLGVEEAEPEVLPLAEAEIAPYTGRYHSPGGYIDLTRDGNQLVLRTIQTRASLGQPIPPPPPPVHAGIIEGDRLLVVEDPFTGTQGEFLRDANGEIAWLRLGKRIHRRER
ncbi:MAG: hypothetical protein M3Z66_20245, partial [Chloroflexota bacterium]|nr:hypothetical protein [Chloroflexota bacterium]